MVVRPSNFEEEEDGEIIRHLTSEKDPYHFFEIENLTEALNGALGEVALPFLEGVPLDFRKDPGGGSHHQDPLSLLSVF